jgi:PKD repeat protein
MLRRKIVILFLLGYFILICVPNALCRSSQPIIYVAGDGSGDFNCHGKNDQIQINQALQFVAENSRYTTVHLKGPFTYIINDTLHIGNNTILEGDPTAVIKLADHAGWENWQPLIEEMHSLPVNNSTVDDNLTVNHNITVRGFEINGNYAGNSEIKLGQGYYILIFFSHCNNVTVRNIYMHDGMGDGLRLNHCKNVRFYNNTVYKLGHEGMFAVNKCENLEAWNNHITCRTNGGLRTWNSNNVKFHDNVIDSFYHWDAGGPGIQIEKGPGLFDPTGVVNDVEIFNNVIHNTYGPGIWLISYGNVTYPKEEAQNVHIHHNIFYSTGTNPSINWVGGIVASGFYDTLIENNVFDGVYHAAITNMYPLVSAGVNPSNDLSPKGNGYTTIVRNNIIVNTRKRSKDPGGTGYGVINYYPKKSSFVLENNCLYNNVGGNYKNCASATDIYANPLFVDPKNHNYRLLSTAGRWNEKAWVKDKVSSPCIDAGYPYSVYSNEPEPNGNRINIGPDGNTMYASKSKLNAFQLPHADFKASVTSGYAQLSVAFTDTSTGKPTSWKWGFGDGTSSTVKNPVHMYSKTGKYAVSLKVTNAAGSDTVTKPNYIVINTLKPPVAVFSASPIYGNAPLAVAFTDKSTGSITSRSWNFGDKSASTLQSPVHKYIKAGKYTVSLKVTNAAGSNTKTMSITVK